MSGDFIELLGNATFTFVAAEQLPPAREDAIRNAVDKREGLPPDDARAALAMVYHQRSQISTLTAEIERLKADNKALAEEADELQALFDLRWKRDLEAVERWRSAAPGRELTVPDRADLVVFLLEQLPVAAQAARERGGENG